jgi:uncharacterized coiled-coil protein SlyX
MTPDESNTYERLHTWAEHLRACGWQRAEFQIARLSDDWQVTLWSRVSTETAVEHGIGSGSLERAAIEALSMIGAADDLTVSTAPALPTLEARVVELEATLDKAAENAEETSACLNKLRAESAAAIAHVEEVLSRLVERVDRIEIGPASAPESEAPESEAPGAPTET